MHSYTASLRIESASLDSTEITQKLALQPTQTRSAGDRRDDKTVWENALWELEVHPTGRSDWDSLEDALTALLILLQPHTKTLRQISQQHAVYLWCGHFSEGFAGVAGGPTFSPQILRKLADLGLPFHLQTYFSEQRTDS